MTLLKSFLEYRIDLNLNYYSTGSKLLSIILISLSLSVSNICIWYLKYEILGPLSSTTETSNIIMYGDSNKVTLSDVIHHF